MYFCCYEAKTDIKKDWNEGRLKKPTIKTKLLYICYFKYVKVKMKFARYYDKLYGDNTAAFILIKDRQFLRRENKKTIKQ